MKNINFNIIKKENIKKLKLKKKTKIKCKRCEFGNFLISFPALFNFLNETSLRIEKNKRVGSDGIAPSQTLPLSSLVVYIFSFSSCWAMIEFFLFLWKMIFSE